MEAEFIQHVLQIGPAGLMGVLWIMERRHSASRERQLSESHDRLMSQRLEISELVQVIKDNCVALTSLERSQQQLISICGRIATGLTDPDPPR